jgi:hypothetical protein
MTTQGESESEDMQEFVSDLNGESDDGLSDFWDAVAKKRRDPRVEVEYEDTDTFPWTQKELASW